MLDRRFPDAFVDDRAAALEADEAERDLYFAPLAATAGADGAAVAGGEDDDKALPELDSP